MEKKRKRRQPVNNNYENKVIRKPEKRSREKTKGKCKVTVQRAVRIGTRLKDRHGAQGMFVKGLRTQFVTRETLNEVNDARRKEDINRIVDIGKIFLQKKKGKATSRTFEKINDRKAAQCGSWEASTDSGSDFECSLSPISLPSFRSKADPPKELDKTWPRGKTLDPEKELQNFSMKYEEAVGAILLHKLSPEDGVLEDARSALTKVNQFNFSGPSSSALVALERREIFFRHEDERGHPTQEVASDHDFQSLFDRTLSNPFSECIGENPLEKVFITESQEGGKTDHSSNFTIFNNEDESKIREAAQFYDRNIQRPNKQLNIDTPPIHFYRRNMF